MTPSAAPTTGSIRLNIVDGTRKPVADDFQALVRVLDGSKRQIRSGWVKGSAIPLTGLPFSDNLNDSYTLIVHADGYEDAGIYPVQLQAGRLIDAHVMMRPSNAQFHFLPYAELLSRNSQLSKLITNGSSNPQQRYSETLEASPLAMGALLTIGAATQDITLADRTSPLKFYWEVIWDLLMPDRFWAWVEVGLAERIKDLAALQSFAEEKDADHWHPGVPGRVQPATRSWKQTRFDVTNVQLTFHENDRDVRTDANGSQIACVVVEPDIDYYKDLLSHGLLEVLPNAMSGGKTDPRNVYTLRWIATKQEGLPDFNPPCTIE